MTFWFPAALLALAAIGFALAPFLRRSSRRSSGEAIGPDDEAGDAGAAPGSPDVRAASGGRDLALRALYRQRREELEEEAASGLIDASSRVEVEQELDRGLLDEFAGETAAPETAGAPATPDRRGLAWLLLAVVIPILTLALYLQVGEPDAELLQGATAVLQLDPERDRLELDRWRVLLAERVERAPDDAQSRYLLGRIYLNDGEYGLAAESFSHARAVIGDDPGIDLAWLQAVYLASEGRLDETGRAIAERILGREPNHPMVLEMLAIDAYRRGDYRESVMRFNRALGNAAEPRRRAALELFLRQSRSMLGDLQPSIDVELKVLEAPPPSATLFVIARPVGGGMPFAVVRRGAEPLPEAVRLDDAVSMNPALPLSAAGEIEVVVRISLTGAAVRHPGDWEWRSAPLSVAGAGTLALVAEIASPRPPAR